MTYQKYFAYLEAVWEEIEDYFNTASSETKRIIFKFTASPYYHWKNDEQERKAHGLAPPKTSSVEKEPPVADKAVEARANEVSSTTEDVSNLAMVDAAAHLSVAAAHSNLADKAQEIREKARTAIKEYSKTGEKQWSSKALAALWALRDDWGKDMTVFMALDQIPDRELCLWNDKHGVFE